MVTKNSTITLTKGWHPIDIDFFQASRQGRGEREARHGTARRAMQRRRLRPHRRTPTPGAPCPQGCCVGGVRLHWAKAGEGGWAKKVVAAPYLSDKEPLPVSQSCTVAPCTPTVTTGADNLPTLSCPPGRFVVGDECRPCPAGSSCAGGTAAPVECPPMFYAREPGLSACSPCEQRACLLWLGA